MKSIENISDFISCIEKYISLEYDEELLKKFLETKTSKHIYYALTDCFICDRTTPHSAGIVVHILKFNT